MILELGLNELTQLVARQLTNNFTFDENEMPALVEGIEIAVKRSEYCFTHTQQKYYIKNGEPYFNPFHTGQYTIFLYFLSNAIFKMRTNHTTLPDRVYYLNKMLNGLDLFYEIDLPDIFALEHPVGAVMGRASYGDYFSFAQNCTVGGNKGIYPTLGENVSMMSGSKILGDSVIGDNVIVSANSYVKDTNIAPCSLVFGISPNLIIKQKDSAYFASYK